MNGDRMPVGNGARRDTALAQGNAVQQAAAGAPKVSPPLYAHANYGKGLACFSYITL